MRLWFMAKNNTTGGVPMSKSKHLPSFILILTLIGLGAPSLFRSWRHKTVSPVLHWERNRKQSNPLREMNWANDTITVQLSFPAAFRGMGRNEIIDSIALLAPVFERLRQVRAGSPKIQSVSFILAIAIYVGISTRRLSVPV